MRIDPTRSATGKVPDRRPAGVDAAGPRAENLQEKTPSAPEKLRQLMAEIERRGVSWTHLRFETDRERGRVVIHVVDDRTGEVIRTVPADLKRYLEGRVLNGLY